MCNNASGSVRCGMRWAVAVTRVGRVTTTRSFSWKEGPARGHAVSAMELLAVPRLASPAARLVPLLGLDLVHRLMHEEDVTGTMSRID